MMKLGFFALRHCADSADGVAPPAGAPQDGCLGWDGEFIAPRQSGQVTHGTYRVFSRWYTLFTPQAARAQPIVLITKCTGWPDGSAKPRTGADG